MNYLLRSKSPKLRKWKKEMIMKMNLKNLKSKKIKSKLHLRKFSLFRKLIKCFKKKKKQISMKFRKEKRPFLIKVKEYMN
jgi:hypothetical protein